MVFIYVLALKSNKYYIGKTNNPNFRLEQHFDSNGSVWTKKYQPLKLLELISGDDFDEDKYTLKYMEKYGINNVRGGSFCEIKMSEENKNTIQKMIYGTTDKCFRCHRIGHYVDDCYAETYDNGKYIDESSDEEYIEVFQCSYCHKEFDTYKGAVYHENMYCSKKNNKNTCYRCGRDSHYANNCFATTHKNGFSLL